MGRTHGVHAEPTTLGLKLTIWYEEMKRNKRRLEAALAAANVGKISGAVGNYAHMPPKLESLVCEELGLTPSPASTQVLQRDRHAEFMNVIAIIAGTLEKMAVEIRGLQKTEFNEITEPFSKNKKGLQQCRTKRPIICERVTGMARVMRGYALTAMENQALWHERDISHSSTERIIFPDATVGLDYIFGLMTKVIDGMNVNEEQMQRNIEKSYNVFFSKSYYCKWFKRMLREDAYRIVQKNAHAAFDEQVLFDKKIKADEQITQLFTSDELDDLFSYAPYTTHADEIFARVYGR